MTHLVERLAELRRHVAHIRSLSGRVRSAADLAADLSLHNDVLFSLLMITQLVIDVAGELSARGGLPFDDYTVAVRNLAQLGVPADVVEGLVPLPGFRNVLLHDYVGLDLDRAVAAMQRLEPVESFIAHVAALEADGDGAGAA